MTNGGHSTLGPPVPFTGEQRAGGERSWRHSEDQQGCPFVLTGRAGAEAVQESRYLNAASKGAAPSHLNQPWARSLSIRTSNKFADVAKIVGMYISVSPLKRHSAEMLAKQSLIYTLFTARSYKHDYGSSVTP
jgi:hypothetical protein